MIRTLIVDDERPARAKIRRLLEGMPDIEIVGEAADGQAAVKGIREAAPDLVFLDVQMPRLDGFGVLAELTAGRVPTVVFVTAFDEYAVRAFEVHALDYLLKPVDPERFAIVLDRIRKHFAGVGNDLEARITRLLRDVGRGQRFLERILVTSEGRSRFLKLAEVSRIESDRNYLILHTARERHSIRGVLGALEKELDPQQWLRVNRSEIVQINRIAHLEPWFHGEYRLRMEDGARTTWSRRYLDRAEEILGRKF
jgi:two-component system LytT family response regulator